MNERILKIARQVWPDPNTSHVNHMKFAELIVKKCMDVAKYHTPDTEECEHTWLIHDKIGKHFGVEE